MMSIRTAILILFVALLRGAVYCQVKTGNLSGYFYSGNGLNSRSMDGAAVRLITATDTLHTVSSNGGCAFKDIPAGKAQIYITHLNFQPFSSQIDIIAGKDNTIPIFMVERTYSIDEVNVNHKVPLITTSGDTIRFNAMAVKLLEGNVALEILKNIPGVEISETGITILGKNVARTYVNNKMIFGNDQMAALVNLPASEVVSIDTYEEIDSLRSTGRKGEEKDRVLNIRTKTPIVSTVNTNAIASYGHKLQKDGDKRYDLGLISNFYSEKLLLTFNGMSNDINMQSNSLTDLNRANRLVGDYKKTNYLDLGMNKQWGNIISEKYAKIDAAYTYKSDDTDSQSSSQTKYFPNEKYSLRSNADTSSVDKSK